MLLVKKMVGPFREHPVKLGFRPLGLSLQLRKEAASLIDLGRVLFGFQAASLWFLRARMAASRSAMPLSSR